MGVQTVDQTGATSRRRGWAAGYMLVLLCLIAVINYIDRQIMAILLQPIKEEFHASDTVMGLVVSTVFAAFFLAASIPIARLADRYPRKIVVAAAVAFWSLMTSLGAVAANVWQIMATRIGVAVAEAGAGPGSHSMVSDLFTVRSRGAAIAAIGGAQSLGVGLGVFLGGWLSDTFSWRISFMIVGLPGILLAAIFLLTTREPTRGQSDQLVDSGETPTLMEAFRTLWKYPSYRCAVLIVAIGGFYGYGILNWGPSFLRRAHSMSGTNVGIWFGVVVAVCLSIGNLTGGILGDFLARRDQRAYMWVAVIGQSLAFPCGLVFLLAPTWQMSIAGLAGYITFYTMYSPVCTILSQVLAPPRVRATASVVLGMATGFMGLLVAPFVIGAINDALTPQFGQAAIRYGLLFVIMTMLPSILLAVLAMRWIRNDIAVSRARA